MCEDRKRSRKQKAREREGGCGDERRETRLVEERGINALFELCKRGAWVIENKLCVCVKEAENGRESGNERKMR